jgi:anhydro-N-acetylmuramic acid kinase
VHLPLQTIGLMSGTSLDGIDAVLARWPDHPPEPGHRAALELRGARHRALPAALRAELFDLNTPGPDELHRAALAANALAREYAALVAELLQVTGTAAREVAALGAHGQTVRHRPGEFDGTGYTLQLLNGPLLAELTGIDVVCDLRSRDVAARGQGAPLVPAFHARVFADPGRDTAVLNLGGIANLTLLPADGPVRGFDCGPGNVLLDLWCQQACGRPFDADGALAARGRVHDALLRECLAEPFLARPAPKSTGRDLFDRAWLHRALIATGLQEAADLNTDLNTGLKGDLVADVMATLAEFTARAAADALRAALPNAGRLTVCGGGARNAQLMARLAAGLPGVAVVTSDALGLPVDQVEAAAFAWLAAAHLRGEAGNLPAVTGAAGPRVLGALHPGRRAGRIRPRTTTRSRRWWWRSGS